MRVKPGGLTEMEGRFVTHMARLGDVGSAARAAGSRERNSEQAGRVLLRRPRVWNALQARIAQRMAQLSGPALDLIQHALEASRPRGNRKATVSASVGLRAAQLVIGTVATEAKAEGSDDWEAVPQSEDEIDAQLARLQRHKAVLDAVDVDPFDDEDDPFDG